MLCNYDKTCQENKLSLIALLVCAAFVVITTVIVVA